MNRSMDGSAVPEKRRARLWHRAIAVAVGVVVAMGLALLLWPSVGPILTAHPRAVDLDTLSDLTGLRFPASSQVVSSSYQSALRAWLQAEVHFDRGDVETFMDSQRPAIEWEPMEDPAQALEPGDSEPHGEDNWSAVVDPPRQHPRAPYQDLQVIDVHLTVGEDGVAVLLLYGASD